MFFKQTQFMKLIAVFFLVSFSTGWLLPAGSTVEHHRYPHSKNHHAEQKTMNLDPKFMTANRQFGFKLYAELAKHSANKNIFVSPASILFALAMAYNGAEGETAEAMRKAMQLQNFKLEDLNAANQALKKMLETADPKVQMQIANSLWVKQGAHFNPTFATANQTFYNAEARELDFLSPAAAATINRWVNDNTRGKIDKIVDQIDRDIILFLINAIYFKGQWTKTFDPKNTREENFTLGSGQQKRVPMMTQSGSFEYFENDKFQAITLPYSNRLFEMVIFLPRANTSLADFHKSLTAENWQSWTTQFRAKEGSISLPRFKSAYEVELKAALGALGMGQAFTDTANFSKMFQPPQSVAISQVKHKAVVEVNEEGTEAAAVTSITMRTTSLGPPPFRMVVDHPFFFAIREKQSGAILFMGSIVEPK
ncbi:MAG: serpin family protein [Acidobacteriota bacterium]